MTPDEIRAQRRRYGATRPDMVPPGSVGWCWVKLSLLETYYRTASSRFTDIQTLWDELVAHEAWRVIPDGDPYGTPEAMLKGELGITMPKFREELSRREQVFRMAQDKAVTAAPAVGVNQHTVGFDNIKPNKSGGTSAEYLVRRLKRDAPEHAAKLAAGEYRSARQAAIAAGIVKEPSLIEQALALVSKMTRTQRAEFWRLVRKRQLD